MRLTLRILLALIALALVIASFLPVVETNAWWVRMMDFPRLQLLIALVVTGTLLLLLARGAWGATVLLLSGIVGAIAYHGVKLWPYLPGEAEVAACPAERRFSVMVANVKLGNRKAEPLLDIVRERQPDLFLAMETDEWWDRALSTLDGEMPYKVQRITGSYFGIHLFSRLPLSEKEVRSPVEQDAPAVVADVALPGGETARFIGVHPRPPHPSQSSAGRDAQLMWAALTAREGRGNGLPTIVAGDLNAVPWESTLERMQRVGGLVDPRQRFGFIPTYDAGSWWMAWPLDQVLHDDAISVIDVERLADFGSDHYPYAATLCLASSSDEAPELEEGDLEEAKATIEAALAGAPESAGD